MNARQQKGFHVRLTEEQTERLKAAAEERGVSLNWLVKKLVEEGMARLKPAEEFSLFRKDLRCTMCSHPPEWHMPGGACTLEGCECALR